MAWQQWESIGTYAGVVLSFSSSTWGAGAEGAAGVDTAGVDSPLVDFSLLKTLLILFTYFPKLLRRSSLASEGPGPDGVDMLAIPVGV